jgi:cell division initiation protein
MVGFDPDEVNSFLEMVAAEFETMLKQSDELATSVKQLEHKLETFVKIEKTLNDTLLTAQKATDDAHINAQKEAELILRDAQVRADKYEDDSRRRVHQLESELVSLRNQRDSFLARFQSMLKTQLGLLAIISGDLKDPSETTRRSPDETMDEVPPQPTVSSLDA